MDRVATADLDEAAEYISKASKYYAAAFVREVKEATQTLVRFGHKGRVVPELGNHSIREVVVQSHRVIYRIPDYKSVEILAVVHGARDLWVLWHKQDQEDEGQAEQREG